MRITKRKCKGVLADMIADMDEDSLARTREKMVGMSYHNTDIAACGHATCPLRTTCLRWQLGQQMPDYQWWANFKPEDKGFGYCKHEIYNKPNNDNDNGNKEN